MEAGRILRTAILVSSLEAAIRAVAGVPIVLVTDVVVDLHPALAALASLALATNRPHTGHADLAPAVDRNALGFRGRQIPGMDQEGPVFFWLAVRAAVVIVVHWRRRLVDLLVGHLGRFAPVSRLQVVRAGVDVDEGWTVTAFIVLDLAALEPFSRFGHEGRPGH